MKYLNEKEIICTISQYLKESIYDYAIMINGTWGSGKTYFVKEKLIPALEDNKLKSIHISLYGLKDSDDIANQLFSAITESKLPENLKDKKIIPSASSLSKTLLERIGINESSANDILSPFLDYSKYYFIFDDLERCSMPINEALGYINHFLEERHSKIIIIANEAEIGSVERQRNLELKYSLATNELIKFPKTDNYKLSVHSVPQTVSPKPTLDIEELRKRNAYLFAENEIYLQIKEKLVGRTIYYQPILDDIVPAIVKKCFVDKADICVPAIVEIFKEKNYFNIRTLQFALLFYARIFSLMLDIKTKDNDTFFNETMNDVLLSIIRVSLEHKNGTLKYEWSDESEYGNICLNENILNPHKYFISFKFVHDYICFSDYNEEKIKQILDSYIQEKQQSSEEANDPINQLINYWEIEEEKIITMIKQLYNNLTNNKYSNYSYKQIISLLFSLKDIGIEPLPIADFLDIIKSDIEKGIATNNYRNSHITKESPCYDDYIAIMEWLGNIEKNLSNITMIDKINTSFTVESGWGEGFTFFCRNNKDDMSLQRGFFCHININRLIEAINNSSASDLSFFRQGLSFIYGFKNLSDYFSADIENINSFKNMLEELNPTDKIIKLNIDLLLGDISSMLERLGYIEPEKEKDSAIP